MLVGELIDENFPQSGCFFVNFDQKLLKSTLRSPILILKSQLISLGFLRNILSLNIILSNEY